MEYWRAFDYRLRGSGRFGYFRAQFFAECFT
jgi:hypothetical protein